VPEGGQRYPEMSTLTRWMRPIQSRGIVILADILAVGKLGAWPTPARRAVGAGFETRNEGKIHDLCSAVDKPYHNGSPGRNDGQYFRVFDLNRSAISRVDVERVKRPRLMHSSDLVDGHCIIVPSSN
jgi:hypothetical protein